ncbi:MAG: site-specific integrase [Bacilli bacterium]
MTTGRVIKRNGKWAYVISLPYDPEKGRYPQRWRSGFETKKMAQDALTRDITALDDTISAVAPTVEEYLREFLLATEKTSAPKTYETYRFTIENSLLPYVGSVRLDKLTHEQIEDIYRKLQSRGLAPSSVHRAHRVLRAALNRAVKRGILDRSPMGRVDAPSGKIERRQALDVEDAQKLLNWLKIHHAVSYIGTYIALHTGMRRGEICGLRWCDVDLDKKIARVVYARQRRDRQDFLADPKTPQSRRTIPLSSDLVAELQSWRQEHEIREIEQGEAPSQTSFVLRALDGTVPDPSSLSHDMADAVRALHLPKVSFHDLRHTHATLLLVANVPLKVVSERLGHTSITVTANTYSHVTDQLQIDATEKFENLFRKNNL